jgi:hypothetical protein
VTSEHPFKRGDLPVRGPDLQLGVAGGLHLERAVVPAPHQTEIGNRLPVAAVEPTMGAAWPSRKRGW